MKSKNENLLSFKLDIKTKSIWVIFFFCLFVFLRFTLSNNLPAYVLTGMPHDDGWLVSGAANLLKFRWLGHYDQFTLIKGPFSPIFMASANIFGFSFIGLNTFMYCLACVIFIISINPILKNKFLQTSFFIFLLFNPIMYALETGQRIYRNGMGQWEILLLFGCLIAIFIRRGESLNVLIKWILLCGFTFGAFILTREDIAWAYPFIFGLTFFTILFYIYESSEWKKKIIVFFGPFVIVGILISLTSLMNYSVYGSLIVNDRNSGYFSKVAGDLHSIAPDVHEDELYTSEAYKHRYFNIYMSTVEKAFLFSPTLNSISNFIRKDIEKWGSWVDFKEGQLPLDFMLWALRDGVKSAGYYKSLPETENFYMCVHQELQEAFKKNLLEKKKGFLISPLIKLVTFDDLINALFLLPSAIGNIISYNEIKSELVPVKGPIEVIDKFKIVSGANIVFSHDGIKGSKYAEKFYKRYVKIANHIIDWYKNITPLLAVISFLAYLYITFRLIKKPESSILSVWIILTGLLLSFNLFLYLMCVITVTSFPTLGYIYTAPSYIMFYMFAGFSLCYSLNLSIDRQK